jgi:hypothetical protein
MIKDVRGLGLLSGIEFQPPRELRLKVPYRAFAGIHPAMFGQVLVMRLFRDRGIYSQICGNAFLVLKASPALNVSEAQLETYVDGLEAIVALMHGSIGSGARRSAWRGGCSMSSERNGAGGLCGLVLLTACAAAEPPAPPRTATATAPADAALIRRSTR